MFSEPYEDSLLKHAIDYATGSQITTSPTDELIRKFYNSFSLHSIHKCRDSDCWPRILKFHKPTICTIYFSFSNQKECQFPCSLLHCRLVKVLLMTCITMQCYNIARPQIESSNNYPVLISTSNNYSILNSTSDYLSTREGVYYESKEIPFSSRGNGKFTTLTSQKYGLFREFGSRKTSTQIAQKFNQQYLTTKHPKNRFAIGLSANVDSFPVFTTLFGSNSRAQINVANTKMTLHPSTISSEKVSSHSKQTNTDFVSTSVKVDVSDYVIKTPFYIRHRYKNDHIRHRHKKDQVIAKTTTKLQKVFIGNKKSPSANVYGYGYVHKARDIIKDVDLPNINVNIENSAESGLNAKLSAIIALLTILILLWAYSYAMFICASRQRNGNYSQINSEPRF